MCSGKNTMLLLLIFIAQLFFILGGRSEASADFARNQHRTLVCVANMKAVEGAAELYFMQQKPPTAATLSIEILCSEKYLGSIPICGCEGAYSIKMENYNVPGKDFIFCSGHGGLKEVQADMAAATKRAESGFVFKNIRETAEDVFFAFPPLFIFLFFWAAYYIYGRIRKKCRNKH